MEDPQYRVRVVDEVCALTLILLCDYRRTPTCSTVLTILDITDVAEDPVARHAALISLICALMSVLYCCMYTVCFGSMRKVYKAAEWAAVCTLFVEDVR